MRVVNDRGAGQMYKKVHDHMPFICITVKPILVFLLAVKTERD